MLEIRPPWDPTDAVAIRVWPERREVTVTTDAEELRYRLDAARPERLGWVERSDQGGASSDRRVSTSEVVLACLREWEAEEAVIELTVRVGRGARGRGGDWHAPGQRLIDQARSARQRERVSPLALQVLWRHRSHPARRKPLSESMAAARIGYIRHGRADTQRLMRRLGLAGDGEQMRCRSVDYRTGVVLCQAIGVDPVEVGL